MLVQQTVMHTCILRLTVVSRKAKEEVASDTSMDSRLTRVSILQVQELWKSKMP